MEFIKNHFYKLTKEVPVKQLSQMPSWYYGYLGNSDIYGTFTISNYYGERNRGISNVSSYEASIRFKLGRIYQAFSKTALYDGMGCVYSLDGNEIECFEEVEIGLNEISKRFMEKHINSNKMGFQFIFLDNNIVRLTITLNGKHITRVSLIGVMAQVNEMLHNAYIELRKAYIKNFKINLGVNYRLVYPNGRRHYIYDIETCFSEEECKMFE